MPPRPALGRAGRADTPACCARRRAAAGSPRPAARSVRPAGFALTRSASGSPPQSFARAAASAPIRGQIASSSASAWSFGSVLRSIVAMPGSSKWLRLVASSAQPGGGSSERSCAASLASSARIGGALARQHRAVEAAQFAEVVGELGLALKGADHRLERQGRRQRVATGAT